MLFQCKQQMESKEQIVCVIEMEVKKKTREENISQGLWNRSPFSNREKWQMVVFFLLVAKLEESEQKTFPCCFYGILSKRVQWLTAHCNQAQYADSLI